MMSDSTKGIIENRRSLERVQISHGHDRNESVYKIDLPNSFTPSRFLITIPHETAYKSPNCRNEQRSRHKHLCSHHDRFDEYPQKIHVQIGRARTQKGKDSQQRNCMQENCVRQRRPRNIFRCSCDEEKEDREKYTESDGSKPE